MATRRRSRHGRWRGRHIAWALALSGVAGGVAGRIQHYRDRTAANSRATATSAAASAAPKFRSAKPLPVAETIYDAKLNVNWSDWGWGRHDLSAGPARVVFGGYAGIIFHHQELARPFGGFAFQFKAPPDWAPFLTVYLKHTGTGDAKFPQVDVKAEDIAELPNGWREAWLAWSRLNPNHLPIDGITISASRQVGSDWVSLDKIVLTKADHKAADAPVRDAELAILCDEHATAISPMIYGISMSAWGSGASGNRIGGNPTSRLNWDLGAVWNAGKDWFFENTAGTGSVGQWVDDAAAHDALTAVVVPMIGWVAKDKTSVGFPVAKFGKQRATDPFRPDAGNGEAPDGSKLRPGPPTETSVAAPPAKIAEWIRTLGERDRARGKRDVYMYVLDNEPSLWNVVHRDVHPDAVGYDELLERTLKYATVIRKNDPEPLIAGPAEWGWNGYLYSAKDTVSGLDLHTDRRLHGDVPLVPWYLKQLAEQEKKTGVRLLDVLDLHFYPQGNGIYGQSARTDPEGSALRLRSTRALWDPNYVDESWIHEPVRLIPRMKEWVAENYPDTKTSIGEWSFGADDHISGGLATAEALGRFGQQALDAAFYWVGPKQNSSAYWAFRAFRDFDGAGGRFLDFSVPTHEADKLSFFASRDPAGTHLVAVIVNLDPDYVARARVDTKSCGNVRSRRAFLYSETTNGLVEHAGAPAPPGLVESVPPYSIEVLDLTVDKAPG